MYNLHAPHSQSLSYSHKRVCIYAVKMTHKYSFYAHIVQVTCITTLTHTHTNTHAQTQENYLYITGRKKELIITASGEKIAPVPIESAIKRHLPIVSNAMVVGDQQKYLSCLLTLKVEVDHETGLPTNQLSAVALEACQKVGSNALTVNDVTDGDHKILKSIQRGIDRTNKTAICKIQKVGHSIRE